MIRKNEEMIRGRRRVERGEICAGTFIRVGRKKVRSNSEIEPNSKRPKLKILIRNEGQGEVEQWKQ